MILLSTPSGIIEKQTFLDKIINYPFRDIKIYKRKLKHYKDKKNKEAMINLQLQEPTYSLDRIIKER